MIYPAKIDEILRVVSAAKNPRNVFDQYEALDEARTMINNALVDLADKVSKEIKKSGMPAFQMPRIME